MCSAVTPFPEKAGFKIWRCRIFSYNIHLLQILSFPKNGALQYILFSLMGRLPHHWFVFYTVYIFLNKQMRHLVSWSMSKTSKQVCTVCVYDIFNSGFCCHKTVCETPGSDSGLKFGLHFTYFR